MLSINDYSNLQSYSSLKFRYKNISYSLDLVTLPIKPLTAWLKTRKRKDPSYYEWLELATKYKTLVELFYPLVYLNPRVINHLEQSKVLLANNYNEAQVILINYWEDFKPKTVYDFIDLARACHKSKLYKDYYNVSSYINSYLVKTGLILDIEDQKDKLSTNINPYDFYLLFNYLEKSKTSNIYLNSIKELNLMKRIVNTWREWIVINYLDYKQVNDILLLLGFNLNSQLARLLYLLPNDKLEVENLHVATKYNKAPSIDLEYQITEQPTAVIEAYKVLGLKPNTPINEVKVKYHQLIKLYHPDLNNANPNHLQTIQLIEAWNLIKKSTLKM